MHEALICVNFVCNLRCAMCGVWQKPDRRTIEPELYSRLPRDLRRVTLTGGEIFLDPQIERRIEVIHQACPRARILLITNGSLPERVGEVTGRICGSLPDLAVRVSLDGPRELHDRLRGVDGAFDRAMQTFAILKERGVKDLGVSFTLQPENLGATREVAEIARQLDVQFVCNVIQNSDVAYATCANTISAEEVVPELEWVIRSQLSDRHWKQWFRAYFTHLLQVYHQTGNRTIPCLAGQSAFYLNYDGDVYPCNMLNQPLGNIAEESVDAIFARADTKARISRLHQCQCCWTSCNAGEVLRKHPLPMLAWVLQRKILSLLRGVSDQNGNSGKTGGY